MFEAGHAFFEYFLKDFSVLVKRMIAWPPNVFHYFWIIIFILVSIAYMSYYRKQDGIFKRFLKHIKDKQNLLEFKKDLLYFSLRFLYRPLLYGVFLLNYETIQKTVSSALLNKGVGFSYPTVHLDPLIGSLIMGFIIFAFKDFCDYLNHYLQHKVKWMWYFHMSHHRSKSLSPLTKYRIHHGEYLQNAMIPLLIEIPGVIFIYSLFQVHGQNKTYTVILFFTYALHFSLVHFRHSHIPIHFGYLSNFFISPHMHQIHHSKDPKHYDKNFGICLTLWDKIFNTHYIPEKVEQLEFGLLEEEKEGKDLNFWEEINDPFVLMYKDIRKILPSFNSKPEINTAFKKNEGFSLIEFVVTIGVSSLIFLGGTMLVIAILSLGGNQEKINQTEGELEQLESVWQTLANHAVNVRFSNSPASLNGTASPATGEGFARTFTYTNDATMPGDSETLMFFAREVSKSAQNPVALVSQFRPTGVFFVKKDPANNVGSKIIIDLGVANANGLVAPDEGATDIVINNVSDLVIDQPQFSTGNVLQSLRVTVTMIYNILSADTTKGEDCLGPTGDIQANIICNNNNTRAFRTLRRSFTLKFSNNKRDSFIPGAEFEFGFYAFPATKPIR